MGGSMAFRYNSHARPQASTHHQLLAESEKGGGWRKGYLERGVGGSKTKEGRD